MQIEDVFTKCSEFSDDIMDRISNLLSENNIDYTTQNDYEIVVSGKTKSDIKDIIDYNNEITKNNGKLIICNKNYNVFTSLFKNIPVIDSEIKAFNIVWKERYG